MISDIHPRLREMSAAVVEGIAKLARVGVAFSGGVDSTLLLTLAVQALGSNNVVGITGVSPSLARAELEDARELARHVGVQLIELPTYELASAAYRSNGPDRCYFCKSELFDRIDGELLEAHQLRAVLYGETADDLRDRHRPGRRAAEVHGALRPLADAGFAKADVRALSRALGLPNWDKPAAPCLASRIPHHTPITVSMLRKVEHAERELRSLGFRALRVRHRGVEASVEVPLADLPRLLEPAMRERAVNAVKACGYASVTVDPAGLHGEVPAEPNLAGVTPGGNDG